MQGYGIGYSLWAFPHVLGFAGAFFAVMTVEAYNEIGDWTSEEGFVFWCVTASFPCDEAHQ